MGWMALGKTIALNSYASDRFFIMGEDNNSKDLSITVPQLPHPKNRDAFSLRKPCKPLSTCPIVEVAARI